jgi:Ca2+-binding RTX toxin-like protein
LAKAPTRDVTLRFTSSDTSEGTLAVGSLTFTANDWNVAQNLTVTGVQDYDADGTVAYEVRVGINTLDVNYERLTVPAIQLTNAPDVTLNTPGHTNGNYADGIDRDEMQVITPANTTASNDVFAGLDGADRIYGGYGMDDLSGGIGDDRIYGEQDDDRLYGDAGNDQLFGGEDDDRLEGGTGNDTLDGGMGRDTMIGGPGNDVYYLGYDASDIIDDQGLTTDIDKVIMPYALTSYTLPTGIENATIQPGTTASSLTGNAANNQ